VGDWYELLKLVVDVALFTIFALSIGVLLNDGDADTDGIEDGHRIFRPSFSAICTDVGVVGVVGVLGKLVLLSF
jgi:hypothetical protein